MSYIYFGSNWENNNILDVFVKYNIVFAGLSEENIDNYKKFGIGILQKKNYLNLK